jgi:WD40 repeat protein
MFINQAEWVGFEAKQGDWQFSVLRRVLTRQQFQAAAALEHLSAVERGLSAAFGLRKEFEQPYFFGAGLGHEWDFSTPQGNKWFVRAFLAADRERYHLFVLIAQGPPEVQHDRFEITTFFNSFVLLFGVEGTNTQLGRVLYEEIDDTANGGRRDNEFSAVAVHPHKPLAVAGDRNGRLSLASKDVKRQFTPVDGNEIEQIVVAPDGSWLALAAGGNIHCWKDWDTDINFGKRTSVPGHRCVITKEFRLLAASADAVKIYDLKATQWLDTLNIDDMSVTGIALSADEKILALHDEKTIALWSWPEKKLLGKIAAHEARISTVVFTPDGKTLASASADRTIKLWDVATRSERAALKQHAWTVWSLAFTPDGKHLASGGLDGMLLLWDLQPKLPTLIWAQAHQFPVRGVAFDAAGKHCYTTSRQAIHIPSKEGQQYRRQLRQLAWADVRPNPEQAAKMVAQCAGLYLPISNGSIYIARDGQTIATTSDAPPANFNQFPGPAHMVRIWDAPTARQRQTLEAAPNSVLSPDGRWLAFSAPLGHTAVQVMEVSTKRVSPVLWRADNNLLPITFFGPDGACLWIVAKNELIQFELPKGKAPLGVGLPVTEKRRLKFKNAGEMQHALNVTQSLNHKSFLVSVGAWDQSLWKRSLHSVEDGKELPWPKFADDERSGFLFVRRQDVDSIELVDSLSGITRVVGRQAAWMQTGIIDPDARLFVSGGSLSHRVLKITVWDLKEKRPLLAFPELGARHINRMYFSPDGRFIAYIANAGITRVLPTEWLLERKELLACNANEVAGP